MSQERTEGHLNDSLDPKNIILRVSRPVSACQRCRSAKIKCDGKIPACTACERAGRPRQCSSFTDQSSKGLERSFVSSLETRIDKIEREISQAAKRHGQSCESTNYSSVQQPSSKFYEQSYHQSFKKEASNVNDLVSDFGFLSVNATARDFHGFATDISFSRLVLSTSILEKMPTSPPSPSPRRGDVLPLIQHYLDNIHVLYPFISEAKIFSSLSAVCDGNPQDASPLEIWITMMIIAISFASLASSRDDARYQNAVRFASTALEQREAILQPGSVGNVQAMLLMVLYALWDPHHFNSWFLIGVTSRVMVDVGLHHATMIESRGGDSFGLTNVGSRYRTFQSVYALDRSISMVHERAFSFTDDSTSTADANVFQQTFESRSPLSPRLESAGELFKLRKLQSTYYQRLCCSERLTTDQMWPIVQQAFQDLDQWLFQIPAEFDGAIQSCFELEIPYTKILMLSRPDFIDPLQKNVGTLIFQHAGKYIELLSNTIRGSEKLTFFTSHDLLRVSFVSNHYIRIVNWFRSQALIRDSLSTWEQEGSSIHMQEILSSLDKFGRVIDYFGTRFGYPHPLQEYQSNRSDLESRLKTDLKFDIETLP